MGIATPGGDETDEFIVPGGAPPPEHLTADNLSFIGHLLGTSLQPLAEFAEFTDKGEQPGQEVAQDARTARKSIIAAIDYLLSRYGADIDTFLGLRDFLERFQQEVRNFNFPAALADYRAAKGQFKF